MKIIILAGIVLSLLFSCVREVKDSPAEISVSGMDQDIIKVNQYLVKRNRDHINGFLKRTGWEMERTGSGLYFQLEEKGTGKIPTKGDRVSITYSLYLMDGTPVSSSDAPNYTEFVLGKSHVERGVDEAVSKMPEGSKARAILLPHLAYGNFGDPSRGIPVDAVLLYFIHLKKVE